MPKTITVRLSDEQYEQMALQALRQAAKEAWKLSRQTHTPFIVYRDGKVVDLNAPATAKPAKS